MTSRLITYVRGLFRRRTIHSEVDEELQFHLEQEIHAHVARGVPADEARRMALRDLGGVAQTKESVRDVRTLWCDTLWQDFRYAAKRLLLQPGFTIVALLTLTLSVGTTTAILGVADAVLFRPLPYTDPDRVFVVQMMNRTTGARSTLTPYAFIDAINALDRDLSDVGMTDPGPRAVETTPDGPRRLPTQSVSAGYFRILGLQAIRGRIFDERDTGREGHSAMLSYSTWRERFAGDETIVGKSIQIGDMTFDIVGIIPPEFVFPSLFAGKPEIVTEMKPLPPGTRGGAMHSIVRVAPGISREQAQAQMDAAVSPLAAADATWKDTVPVLDDVRTVLYGRIPSPIMRFLVASAVLLLLIGSANLANMLLVRGHRSTHETAMRLALGAGLGRLIRPIVIESMMIGLFSGGLAILVTYLSFEILLRHVPPTAYGGAPVGIDARVAGISMAISLMSALTFAALPAWRAARLDVLALLRGRVASRRTWLGRPLIVAQVAFSVVAAFGAIIAARAFVTVLNTPLGFTPEDIVRISVPPPPASTNHVNFYIRVLDTLRVQPDVLSVGASTGLPLGTSAPYSAAKLPGAQSRANVGIELVLPGFFETIGMSVVQGRLPTSDDLNADLTAAVVSESAAHAMFPNQNPLGQVFLQDRTEREFHVIGVVADARQSFDRADSPRAYIFPTDRGILVPVIRVRNHSDAIMRNLKAAVRTVARESFVEAGWWTDSIGATTAYRNPQFQTIVLGSMALLAVVLTAVGTFGVVSYSVIGRTREMGVRLAIGASPNSLIMFVLRGALVPLIVGLAAGVLAIGLIRPLAEAQLFKVDTHDPRTLALAAIVVGLATVAAAYLPARRVSKVDPVSALRTE